jgi:alpha-D-ribose 1-methylphosphonate 5-phosphate C-P lyase
MDKRLDEGGAGMTLDTRDTEGRPAEGYNFAYLDEQTKRMIRRGLLKALSIPGYQVPFGGREMPLAYGWGTGGIQVTASIIGPDDRLKVIDQGCDDTTNAVSIRRFFETVSNVATTDKAVEATIIQTRHRVPETPLGEGQILVYQVPRPEPLSDLEPRGTETRKMHAYAEYGAMQVSLYEDIARFGRIARSYSYPVMVNNRHLMSPSPIPAFDNPKLQYNPAIQLFGAGREKRLYAIPPYTSVRSLDFEDRPFEIQTWEGRCSFCGSGTSYLNEIVTDDRGSRMWACSDTDFCRQRQAEQARAATTTTAVEAVQS